MLRKTKMLFALAAVVSLMGQGCAAGTSTSSNSNVGAKVDAAVNADINAASSVDAQERSGDSDANLMNNDQTELNSYSQSQYDLP